MNNLIKAIKELKKEKNAIILGHYYQKGEIQDIADYVGDSLALAQLAAKTEADIIVMCGVHFMGETAKVLCPDKKVLVPDMEAGCSLADSCPADQFAQFVKEHPGHTVISYVNTTAAVKAVTDVVVTSTNARQIVESFPEDEKIIFGPDRNLGNYINSVTNRNMLLWDGACHVHEQFSVEKIVELKAQHPDYEISQMGIHAQRGVSCADCHMPYKSEGGMKFSDHHIQSPLAMIDRTCQVCHRESEETLRNNVYDRQRKANEIRGRLEHELAKAHIEAKFAWDKGATDAQMAEALKLIRQAQWRWDFGVASHGGAFHAPQEIQRILGHGLDKALQARLAISKVLAQHGYTADVPMPDISTKEKAQEYIGLDMEKERKAKDKFLKTIVPEWLEKARANGRLAKL